MCWSIIITMAYKAMYNVTPAHFSALFLHWGSFNLHSTYTLHQQSSKSIKAKAGSTTLVPNSQAWWWGQSSRWRVGEHTGSSLSIPSVSITPLGLGFVTNAVPEQSSHLWL